MKNGLFLSILLIIAPASLLAQTAAFTYQGRLVDSGQPANGSYDMQFRLTDAASSGNYVGVTLTNAAVTDSNGLFVVTLDFGASVFDGSARWLEIGVRTNGSMEPYTVLSPLQAINMTPYATFANAAASAALATSITPGALAGTGGLTNGSTAANLTLVNPTFATPFDASNATNLNSTLDSLPRTFGSEYLYHWFSLLRSNLAATVVFDGDSTTLGTGILSVGNPAYLLQNIVPTLMGSAYSPIVWRNIAVSGVDVVYWATNAVQTELAANPDLLIVRFGMNGPEAPPGNTGVLATNFASSVISALTTLRSARSVSNLSIIVMMPNTSGYYQVGHYAPFFEAQEPIFRDAARQFQCAFMDTYTFLKDPTNSAGLWMDSYLTHPLEEMNLQIGGWIADFICPLSIRNMVQDSYLTTQSLGPAIQSSLVSSNISLQNMNLAPTYALATNPPSWYTNFISVYRAPTSTGWPFDGQVTTFNQVAGVWWQLNSSYYGPNFAIRAGGSSGWFSWWTNTAPPLSGLSAVSALGIDASGNFTTNAVPASGLQTTNTPSAGQVLKFDGTNMYWSY